MEKMPVAYNGSAPYVFISYAHADSAKVFPIIQGLQNKGFRVWYDAGIEAGTEWPEYIAEKMDHSSCIIAFISAASLNSQNCRREINYAIDQRKELLTVYLEDVKLSSGMKMQLGTLQAMFLNRYGNTASFVDSLSGAQMLRRCNSNSAYVPPVSKPQQSYQPVKPAKSAPNLKPLIVVAVIVVAIIVGIAALSGLGGDGGGSLFASEAEKYAQALELIGQGEYYDAFVLLEQLGDYEDSASKLESIRLQAYEQRLRQAVPGDTVQLGSYDQDDDASNGKEVIEWIVLAEQDGKKLLLSRYCLDSRPYENGRWETTWADCAMRGWLNETFLYEAFTEAEQAMLAHQIITTVGSADVTDPVILLSEEEFDLYGDRIPAAELTAYATRQGGKSAEWWLRSPWISWGYLEAEWTVTVYANNSSLSERYVDSAGYGVRPAVWVDTRTEAEKETAYAEALTYFENRQYEKALEAFRALDDYQDSQNYCTILPRLILQKPFVDAQIGSTLNFGLYNSKPLNWTVVAKADGRVLLMTTYSVLMKDYHNYTLATPGWENCTLREWLNDDFYYSTFDADQQTLILQTENSNPANPEYGTSSGGTTNDYVFILSYDEVMTYLPEASSRRLYTGSGSSDAVKWWLRTIGASGGAAVYVDKNGSIDLKGDSIIQFGGAYYVRACVWIDIGE